MQAAGQVDRAVLAGFPLDLLVQLDRVLLEPGDVGVAVERVHPAGRVPGRAGLSSRRSSSIDVGPAGLREVVEHARTDHAATDDHDLGGRLHRAPLLVLWRGSWSAASSASLRSERTGAPRARGDLASYPGKTARCKPQEHEAGSGGSNRPPRHLGRHHPCSKERGGPPIMPRQVLACSPELHLAIWPDALARLAWGERGARFRARSGRSWHAAGVSFSTNRSANRP